MIMCVLLCYPVSIHMSQLLSTGCPISSYCFFLLFVLSGQSTSYPFDFSLAMHFFMSSLCGVGVRVRVNNFSSKTTRPRDMLFFLKDTLSIEDEKLFKQIMQISVRLFARDITREVPPPKV